MSRFHLTDAQWWHILIVIGVVYFLDFGAIEGRIFPAAAPMELLTVKVEDGRGVVFSGRTNRLRPECNFREMRWFLGNRGRRNVPISVTLGPSKVRPDGPFTFEGWRVPVPSAEILRDNTFGNVYHQCSVLGIDLPWLTKTQFWN